MFLSLLSEPIRQSKRWAGLQTALCGRKIAPGARSALAGASTALDLWKKNMESKQSTIDQAREKLGTWLA